MKDQRVVVTGAAQGIGEAIARRAIDDGAAAVALVDRNADKLHQTVANLSRDGVLVVGIEADLRRRATCHDAIRKVASKLGGIDVLVNNAGIYNYVAIEDIDDDEWDVVMDICLRGLFHTSVAAIEHLRTAGGGRIVNVASVDGFVAFPEMAHYAAAKAGVISITRSFAIRYASERILVNAIAPGLTDTPRIRANERTPKVIDNIPLGRPAHAAEIASAVCYLAHPENTYMTGEVMNVSGGLVIA